MTDGDAINTATDKTPRGRIGTTSALYRISCGCGAHGWRYTFALGLPSYLQQMKQRRPRETHEQAAKRRERLEAEFREQGRRLAHEVIAGNRGIVAVTSFSGDRGVLFACVTEIVDMARKAAYTATTG